MKFLIDTNILSEIRKGVRADAGVAAWFRGASESDLFLSVLVVGEIWSGIERLRKKDKRGAEALEAWLNELTTNFQDRILPVTVDIVRTWGSIAATRSRGAIDGLLAATALVNDLVLVTRNTRDFHDLDVRLLNPFEH